MTKIFWLKKGDFATLWGSSGCEQYRKALVWPNNDKTILVKKAILPLYGGLVV